MITIRRKPLTLRACRRCGQATAKDTCRSCSSWDQHKDRYEPRSEVYDSFGKPVMPRIEPSLPRVEWAERPMPKVWP